MFFLKFFSDAFSSQNPVDAFGDSDPFGSAFGAPAKPVNDGFNNDPFGSAFGGPAAASPVTKDPFDPFGDKARAGAKTPVDVRIFFLFYFFN